MSRIGHNRGPSLDPGHGWRKHCWSRARADLLPRMPIEIVRRRVARAAELGLDYRTYAGFRATTGRDIVAFLFSTNALQMHAAAPPRRERVERLAGLRRCGRVVLAQPPAAPAVVAELLSLAEVPVERVGAAPGPHARWSEARIAVLDAVRPHPADAVVLVGAAPWERCWVEAARLAGFVGDGAFFGVIEAPT